MKKLHYSLTLLIMLTTLFASGQNHPCNPKWHDLDKVFTHSIGDVFIRFQSSTCYRNGSTSGLCGFPKIAILHTFQEHEVSISLSLKGTDCDGKPISGSFSSYKKVANEEYRGDGNWHTFKSIQKCSRVNITFKRGNDYYDIAWDAENGINKTLKNNSPLLSNGLSQDEENEKNENIRKAEEQKKQEEENRLKKQKEKEEQDKEDKEQAARENKQKADEERREKETAAEMEGQRIRDSILQARQERDDRVEKRQEEVNTGKAVQAGMVAGAGAVILNENLEDYDYLNKKLAVKGYVGIGIENLPVIQNNYYSDQSILENSSSLSNSFPITLDVGLPFMLINKKQFRFHIVPQGQLGVTAAGGTIGYYFSYGGKGGFSIGNNIRFLCEAAYYSRSLTETTDSDASNATFGITTNTGDSQDRIFNYSLIRLASGIGFRFKEKSYIKADKVRFGEFFVGAFADKPTYFPQSQKPVIGFDTHYNSPGGFYMKGMYSGGYPFSGDAKFTLDEKKNGTYFSVSIGKLFGISKH